MNKIKETASAVKQDVTHKTKNAEEILNAVAMSAVVAFSGYQAYQHRQDGVMWLLLGAAAAWSVFQAFKAWNAVLSK